MKVRMQFFRSVRFAGDWEWNFSAGRPGWCGGLGDTPPANAERMNWWSLRIGRSQFAFWHNHDAIFNFVRTRKEEVVA